MVDSLTCTGREFGDTCEPVCKEGSVYDEGNVDDNPNFSTPYVCKESRKFEGSPTCVNFSYAQIYRCRSVTTAGLLEYGDDCSSGVAYHGDTCTVSCPKTHSINVSSPPRCEKGSWNVSATCVPRNCDKPPYVMFGQSHESCMGLPHQSLCTPRCFDGWSFNGDITCMYGEWMITSQCVKIEDDTSAPTEKATTKSTVVQATYIFDPGDGNGEGDTLNREWAERNKQVFIDGYAAGVGVPPSKTAVHFDDPPPLDGEASRLLAEKHSIISANHGVHVDSSQKRSLRSENAFVSTFTVYIDDDDDSDAISTDTRTAAEIQHSMAKMFADDTVDSPASVGGFLSGIRDRLVEEGAEIPVNLFQINTTIYDSARIIPEVTVPSPEWVKGKWENCNTKCGQGRRSRSITCPRGTAANACNGEKPPETGPCSNYDECPYMPLCPAGPPRPSCETQAFLIVGGIFLILFSVAGITARIVCTRCRKPLEGKAVLSSAASATWHVDTWNPADAGPSDGREHVIWDIDQNYLETVLASQDPEDIPEPAGDDVAFDVAPSETVTEVVVSPSVRSAPGNQPAEEISSPAEIPVTVESGEAAVRVDIDALVKERREKWLREVKPIINDRERVEYFSSSDSRWVPATLHITFQNIDMLDEDMSPPSKRILYSLILSQGRREVKDCKVDCMRTQFRIGEPVEIYKKSAGGTWTAGTIQDEPPLSATLIGYRVYAVDRNVVIDKVPSVSLRRRFVGGSAVEVYKGAEKGWSSAVVHSCINAEQSSPVFPEPMCADSPGSLEGNAFQAWTMVPVYEDHDVIVEPEPEWFESYYVRYVRTGQGEEVHRNL
eukprot:TRINITY_DN29945_c0_g1_i1.p1 TRINITY_DN29945_c0_g1~~TRINITY_DN29945_c0_g1_i1.p1  ORF type:complete len:899 (-),score=115.63 TRINITY_DN29945_c0_g1_i1:522-3020(-)